MVTIMYDHSPLTTTILWTLVIIATAMVPAIFVNLSEAGVQSVQGHARSIVQP
jgi:hypothetical protein